MSKNNIKMLLKDAYYTAPSREQRIFIENHEERKMRFFDVLKVELKYMGIVSMNIGICLFIFLFFLVRSECPQFMWMMSSLLPLCAIIPVTSIGRSESYGMDEIEMASRFSLKFVRMVRMLILGGTSFILLIFAGILFYGVSQIDIQKAVFYVAFPYLINIGASLFVIRRWHAKENVYACMTITGMSMMIPFLAKEIERIFVVSEYILFGLVLVAIAVTVREILMYMKESENKSWNYI